MDLRFNLSLAEGYINNAQIARILTEDWFAHNMYCPVCGKVAIRHAEPNAPVKDYVCDNCKSQYELKSKKSKTSRFNASVPDGAYQTMINRITSLDNPSFFFLHYDRYQVNNLVIVPKCFFTPDIIKKRKPLPSTDRRAGWQGCNILMKGIPDMAKIPIVKDGEVLPVKEVVQAYQRIYSLESNTLSSRGWLVDILSLVERLGKSFTLDEMYQFVPELQKKHPENHHVHEKIRQQLQFLRDKELIEFVSRGKYRRL